MKKRVMSGLLVLIWLGAVGTARAQTTSFEARVPFPFVAGNQTLPPGTYRVQRLLGKPTDADKVGIIVLRSTDPRVYKALVTNLVRPPVNSRSGSQLVFADQAGQHYLSAVRIEGEMSHQIAKVPTEFELASSELAQDEIALAGLR